MATLPLEDGTLWYQETGNGTPLVFIHGGWMSAKAWPAQRTYFSDRHRVVSFDLRGHGRTGATDRRRYSVDLFVDDLERLLCHLGVERPVLCGVSLGSMVIQRYLSRHPTRPRGAILAGALRSMPPIELPTGTKAAFSPMPTLSFWLSAIGPRATFRAMLRSIRLTIGHQWLSVRPEIRSQTIDTVGGISRSEFLKIFGALYRYEPADLTSVSSPTLVIHGESEAALVKRQGARIAADISESRQETVPDAAHLVNQDNSAAFNAACSRLLSEIEG